jgi:hypothetical protein
MQTRKGLSMLVFGLVLAGSFTLFTACEKDKDGTDLDRYFSDNPYISDPRSSTDARVLEIDPGTKEITAIDEKVSFLVKGGSGSTYRWDVANTDYGTIAVQNNTRYAVYTVKRLSDNSIIVSDSGGNAGIAYIRTGSSVPELAITPAATTLTATNVVAGVTTVDLLITGGATPYGGWVVSGENIGAMNASQPLGTFTLDASEGTATITVTDKAGAKATATITVE